MTASGNTRYPPLHVVVSRTNEVGAARRCEITEMCSRAYEEDITSYLDDIGSGLHVMGSIDGRIVSHLMIVERWLQRGDRDEALRTAYIELVATDPAYQGRGFASALLRAAVGHMQDCVLGALSPSDEGFYARLGWEMWRGPLSVRTARGLEPTPGEEVMILRLPQSPAGLDVTEALSVEWRPGELW